MRHRSASHVCYDRSRKRWSWQVWAQSALIASSSHPKNRKWLSLANRTACSKLLSQALESLQPRGTVSMSQLVPCQALPFDSLLTDTQVCASNLLQSMQRSTPGPRQAHANGLAWQHSQCCQRYTASIRGACLSNCHSCGKQESQRLLCPVTMLLKGCFALVGLREKLLVASSLQLFAPKGSFAATLTEIAQSWHRFRPGYCAKPKITVLGLPQRTLQDLSHPSAPGLWDSYFRITSAGLKSAKG